MVKKKCIYKFLYGVSLFLVVGFCVFLVVDGVRYNSVLTSFPFRVFVLVRVVECLLPALVVFVAARILRKKCQ